MALSSEEEVRALRAAFRSERDPDGLAFASLADAYRRGGDFEQALELLRDGLDRHPAFASAHVVAGWVHRDRGAPDDAQAAFQAVLELDGENGEALRGLGELAAARGQEDEALSWLRRLAGLEPGNQVVAGRIEEIEWARTALGSASGSPDASALDDPLALDASSDFEGAAEDALPESDPSPTADDPLSLDWFPADGEPVAADVDGLDDLDMPAGEARGSLLDAGEIEGVEVRAGEGDRAAEVASDEAEGEVVHTRTMAELYERQGLHGRALAVYEHLLERTPDDEALRRRVEDLRARIASAPPVGAPPAVGATAPDGARSATLAREQAAEEEDVEAVARDWAERPGEEAGPAVPFAWGGSEEQEGEVAEAADGGPSIEDYFSELLSWRPRSASPPSDPVGQSGGREPDVDVADPAPEAAPAEPVVDVADLAPEGVSGESVVDVADLAPEAASAEPVVDVADLAPEAPVEPERDAGGDPLRDAFGRWLDELR